MRLPHLLSVLSVIIGLGASLGLGQAYGPPDRDQPGDEMIQQYLAQEAERIDAKFGQDTESLEKWEKLRPTYQQEYLYMLGLWPRPEKTPLEVTVTGTLAGDGYVVEMLHYQSIPRLYVTANLYRPAKMESGRRLPAVLYVCGHSNCGRNGNKTAYQSHGIWFARHGYVCLVLDTLQLGEIAAIHHGTYREGRWWWHSRGYTPAGVECLNGIRGLDYLLSRPDVDPQRLAVTGISGGGAATFWIAAADERVKVAVPVSGMADLPSYVSNRVVNGHCDCMFLHNSLQWPWTRIAALIAPRPLLFVNSDQDAIFPMDANQRVINRLERLYSLYGAGDLVDSFVSIGDHAYRKDIRQAAYRFINMHLKNDARAVEDSEVDLPAGPRDEREYPISPERLRVFPADSDIPKDELNTTIDRHFVPPARVDPPANGAYEAWKAPLAAELRRVAFGCFPERIGPAEPLSEDGSDGVWLSSEPGIRVHLQRLAEAEPGRSVTRIVLAVHNGDVNEGLSGRLGAVCEPGDRIYACTPRGVGETRWTRKNPPNYVERSHVLLGRTVDTGRVWDIIAAARYLRDKQGASIPIHVLGEGPAAVLAAYAALWEPEIAGVIAVAPPASHMEAGAPQFLNALRVCDVPEVFGMLAPRSLTLHECRDDVAAKVARIYAAAGASERLTRLSGERAGGRGPQVFTQPTARPAPAARVLRVRPTEDFAVNGNGDASAWAKAAWEPLHLRTAGGRRYETRVKMLYSPTGLYVLMEAEDRVITATMNEDFLDLWNEDVFEFFLWPDERYPAYFEYEISPLGFELPILIPNFEGRFLGWRPWHYEGKRKTQKATAAVGGSKQPGARVQGWKAEVFVPYDLLRPLQNVPPQPGTRWRANFYRVDYDDGKTTSWDWARVGPSFHEFHKFGALIFE